MSVSCDPTVLLASANCILDCLTSGQMDAVRTNLLCNIANNLSGAGGSSIYVLKSGDTMTGSLLTTDGNSFQSGLPISSDITAVTGTPFASYFGSAATTVVLCRYTNNAGGPSLTTFKTRSTTDTSADVIVQNGDELFSIMGYGADGVNYIAGAGIKIKVDGTPGVGDMPGRIEFYTTLDGTGTPLLRWTVDNTGLFTGVNSVRAHNATAIPAGGTAGAGLLFSSTANFGIFFGSNAPGLSAAKGSLYLRSNGTGINDRAYINTDGATTWTAIVTVA